MFYLPSFISSQTHFTLQNESFERHSKPAAAADVGPCSITVSLAVWRPGGSPLGQVWRLEPLPSAAAPLRIPTTLSETGTYGVRVVDVLVGWWVEMAPWQLDGSEQWGARGYFLVASPFA
jgi:hypothetical protein